jgi:hypothetical protein
LLNLNNSKYMKSHDSNSKVSQGANRQIALIISATLLGALYMLMRYGGLWGETDTAIFTQAMRAIVAENSLVPKSVAYSNGYGYQILGIWLAQISGIKISSLQLYVAILLAPWVVLPAWLLYRELCDSGRAATFACIILLVLPDFLFPLLRGTHEKFTRGLMAICLFLLLKSMRDHQDLRRLVSLMVAFYFSAYALISFNNLLATSFIAALTLTALMTWLVQRWTGQMLIEKPTIHTRLIYVVSSLFVIAFIFTFYAYPPAQEQIRSMHTIADRIVALLLQFERVASNPYTVVTEGWISLPVYFALSLANWLLLGVSSAIWLSQASSVIRRRPFKSQNDLLLWSLFAAFTFQGILSILIDVSGAVATNFQHRIFPTFALIAAPFTAKWLVTWEPESTALRKIMRVGIPSVIAVLAILALVKATSEPLLSNKWLFHLPGERQAIRWSDQTLADRWIWTGFDERVNTAVTIRNETKSQKVRLDQYDLEPETRNVLISQITRLRGLRVGELIPIDADDFVVYDNGQAQIYHLRPRTPFQW